MTPGLGNRCSIRLSYGDVLVFNWLRDWLPQQTTTGYGMATAFCSGRKVHPGATNHNRARNVGGVVSGHRFDHCQGPRVARKRTQIHVAMAGLPSLLPQRGELGVERDRFTNTGFPKKTEGLVVLKLGEGIESL